MNYVLVYPDTNYRLIGPFATNYRLIGPFATPIEAARWAKRKENNPSDDPRWQTIYLDQPETVPLIASPDDGPMP